MRTARTKSKGWWARVVSVLAASAGIACDSTTTATSWWTATVDRVSVSPATVAVVEDDTVQLTAVAYDLNDNVVQTNFVWKTSDPLIATVSSSGLLAALAEGTVSVTASAGGKEGASDVSIGRRITSVTVTPSPISVIEDQSVQLSAEALDKQGNPTSVPFGWASANPSIAVVDSTGLVTGVLAGTTTISATANGMSGSVNITVTPKAASVVITGGSSAPLELGLTLQLAAAALDVNGDTVHVPITWASSDEKVLTVDSTGLVTAVGISTATITASSPSASESLEITTTGLSAEGSGNSISWPVVFADGVGITGLAVAADAGVRPLTSEAASAELMGADSTNPAVSNPTSPFWYGGNILDRVSNSYLQNTVSSWRAQIIDGTGQDKYEASASWGDNLISQKITVGKKIRIEVALSATGVGTLLGYNMTYVANPSSPEEIQGTDGTTADFVPLIYTPNPTFTVELNGTPISSGAISAEVNVAGRIVYGSQWTPAAAGTYRLRFTLASGANVQITGASNGEVVNAQETAITVQVQ